MAGSEGINEIVSQEAIQVETAVMMVFRDTNTEPWPTTMASHSKPQKQSNCWTIYEKSSFNWDSQDRWAQLINIEMEDTNILETRAYELTAVEKVAVIKNYLGQKDLKLIDITHEEEEKCKIAKGLFNTTES